MRTFGILALVGLLPATAHAAILINEVAWMGTSVSANAEWMELANTGDTAVDITGWRLVAGNGSPAITLAGTIAGNGYFLLERTSDASVPTVSADQLYTGALTNGGTTLSLTDANGAAIDQVAGGENWADIGGDNANKETAQRTSSGWKTAPATPRAANAGVSNGGGSTQEENASIPVSNNVNASTTIVSSSSGPAEYLPIPILRIVTSGDRTISSGADTAFTARVYDSNGNKRDDAIVTWSFGDGMQRTGFSVFHSYYSPGEYVVVVHARTADDGDALGQSIITVKDAAIKIVSLSNRGITIVNNSSRTLDLSFWRLSMGGQEFKMPADTQILAGRTVLFPLSVIGLPLADSASLNYPSGEVASVYPAVARATASNIVVQPSQRPVSSKEVKGVEPIISARTNVQTYEDEVSAPTATVGTAAVGAALSQADAERKKSAPSIFRSPWTLSLLGVIAVAGGVFILL